MPRRKKLPDAIFRPLQVFCAVCGAVEDLLPRQLVTPDSGEALLCGGCWTDYCAQTGASEHTPETAPARDHQGRHPVPARRSTRRGLLPAESPTALAPRDT